MARLNDHLLVQRVDDLLVFVDESAGQEVEVPRDLVPALLRVVQYLFSDATPGGAQ